jgi:hypothetical protein
MGYLTGTRTDTQNDLKCVNDRETCVVYVICDVQMFLMLTRLVLKAKKDQQARLMQVQASDTVRLNAGSARASSRRKKKCC